MRPRAMVLSLTKIEAICRQRSPHKEVELCSARTSKEMKLENDTSNFVNSQINSLRCEENIGGFAESESPYLGRQFPF